VTGTGDFSSQSQALFQTYNFVFFPTVLNFSLDFQSLDVISLYLLEKSTFLFALTPVEKILDFSSAKTFTTTDQVKNL
jgi:hypothetical protein